VLTTDRSMILATRYRSEGLDEQRPITEALQLFFSPTLNQWATMIRRLMDGGNIV
jgi:aryl carrier-like protein